MFIMEHDKNGWHSPRIQPYAPLALDPASSVLHYGQAIFEGMKAYRRPDGKIQLFRPKDNIKRFNLSSKRLCIPEIDEQFVLEALIKLLQIEKDWVPDKPGQSLYIRPFAVAVDPYVGVSVAEKYLFMIILSPVGAYYEHGLAPVKILVENEYVRAVRGGMGYVKAAGNYACSLIADHEAKKLGCDQVLWLDGVERKYVEEVGSMNIFFKIDGEVITPPLLGSILGGITRDSVLKLASKLGYKASEKRLSIQEIFNAGEQGKLEEVFGTGTAAVISPVGALIWEGKELVVNGGKMGECSRKLYDTLTGIQYGRIDDPFGWTMTI